MYSFKVYAIIASQMLYFIMPFYILEIPYLLLILRLLIKGH